jgi:phenylacetate-CoA ligase
MIRFWTSDMAKLDKRKCKCGRTHARSPGGIFGRVEDRIACGGIDVFPSEVENVVRSIPELSEEFCIELSTDPKSGGDICTIVVECLKNEEAPRVTSKMETGLKAECKITPEIKCVPFGTLPRTTFKAKRVLDKRGK